VERGIVSARPVPWWRASLSWDDLHPAARRLTEVRALLVRDERRGLAGSLDNRSMRLPGAIGPAVAGWLAGIADLHLPFYLAAVLQMGDVVLFGTVFRGGEAWLGLPADLPVLGPARDDQPARDRDAVGIGPGAELVGHVARPVLDQHHAVALEVGDGALKLLLARWQRH
jgi:hypothetical protein